MVDIWNEALQGLQPRLGEQTYDMWLRPIELAAIGDNTLQLTAPNRFMKEWFETHYLGVVLDEIQRRTQTRYTAQIEIATPKPEPEPAPTPAASADPKPAPSAELLKRAYLLKKLKKLRKSATSKTPLERPLLYRSLRAPM